MPEIKPSFVILAMGGRIPAGLMDARRKNFGLLIPTPYHSSYLGKVVYIDQTDTAIAFANIFAELDVPVAGF